MYQSFRKHLKNQQKMKKMPPAQPHPVSTAGTTSGADEGSVLGCSVGVKEGILLSLGFEEGIEEGIFLTLGFEEGIEEGTLLGIDEGEEEGTLLGIDEGEEEGTLLGIEEGTLLGIEEGILLGKEEGILLGIDEKEGIIVGGWRGQSDPTVPILN